LKEAGGASGAIWQHAWQVWRLMWFVVLVVFWIEVFPRVQPSVDRLQAEVGGLRTLGPVRHTRSEFEA